MTSVAATKSSSSFVVVLPTSPRRLKLPTSLRRPNSRLRPVVLNSRRLRRAGCPGKPFFPEFANFQKSDQHSETFRKNSKVFQIEGHEDKSFEQELTEETEDNLTRSLASGCKYFFTSVTSLSSCSTTLS
jgi:hypothetical protein